MSFDIVVRDRIQSSVVTKLRQIEVSAANAARSLGLLQNGVSRSNARVTSLGTNLGSANSKVNELGKSFMRTANIANRLLSGALLVRAADNLIEALDKFKILDTRIAGVSKVLDGNGDVDTVKTLERKQELTRALFETANDARASVSELVKTYRRFDLALANVGESQQTSIDLTSTMSKMLALNGANAGEASAALLQLSQAFNKGKLDGDEFRTTAELMPGVIREIVKVMDIAPGKIYEMAEKGKISVDVMLKAFTNLKEQVDKDFLEMPKTIGQAFTQLNNEFVKAFGEFDKANGFTDKIVGFIDYLRVNLPEIISLMKSLVAAFATQKGLEFGGDFIKFLRPQNLFNMLKNVEVLGLALSGLAISISSLVGYFTFFADGITVTSDKMVTLTDMVNAFFEVVQVYLSSGKTIFGDLFTLEGAQANFDKVMGWLSSIYEVIKALSVTVVAYYDTWKSLSWTDLINLFVQAIDTATTYLKNGILSFIQEVAKGIAIAADFVIDQAIDMFRRLNQVVGAAAGNIPWFGSTVLKASTEVEKELLALRRKSIDWGVTELAESLKTDLSTVHPTWDKMGKTFQNSWQETYANVTQATDDFYDAMLALARVKGTERIAQEQALMNAATPNPGALRGKLLGPLKGDVPTPIDANTGIDAAAKATEKLKKNVDKLSFIKLPFSNLTRGVVNISESTTNATDSMRTLNTSVVTLDGLIDGLRFDLPSQSVLVYETTAVQALSRVSSACLTLADTITTSQTSAWANATRAVTDYANKAVIELNKVSAANGGSGVGVINSFDYSAGGRADIPSLLGFSDGGYTGSGGRNQVAGVVHGQEFVMPADSTAKYRSQLEAMRAGQNPGGGVVNVTIENHSSATHTVEQVSATEVRIIAREIVNAEASKIVARELGNPNSVMSKSVKSNLQVARRR